MYKSTVSLLVLLALSLSLQAGLAQQRAAPFAAPSMTTVLSRTEARKMMRQIFWNGYRKHFGFRTVSIQERAHLEADLPAFAGTVPMPSWRTGAKRVDITTYVRQYAGVTLHGKKLICVNAFSPGFLKMFPRGLPNWHRQGIVFADGGAAAFHALYDPSARRFTEYEFNGPA